MRIKTTVLLMSLLLSLNGFADVASSYSQYSGEVQSMNSSMLQVNGNTISVQRVVNGQKQTQSFQPSSVPNAQAKPAETSYYGKSNDELAQAAGQTLTGNTTCTSTNTSGCNAMAGNAVATNFTSAPKFVVDPTSPSIARSIAIQEDAENIAQGKPGKFTDCQTENVCHTTYTNQTCTEQHQLNVTCTNTLTPEIIAKSYTSECNHMVGSGFSPSFVPGPSGGLCYIEIKNYVGGAGGNFHQGASRQFTLPPNTTAIVHMFFRPMDSNWNFNPSRGSVSFTASGAGLPSFSYVNPPFANNGHGNVLWQEGEQSFNTGAGNDEVPFTYNYSVDSHNSAISKFEPALLYVRYPSSALDQVIVNKNWVNSCQNSQMLSQCAQTTNECTQGAASRLIGHQSVTADCWEYTSKYQCGQNSNSCTGIQGCDQVHSQCTMEVAGTCLSYTNTYQCPQNQCTAQGMICGGNFFCIKGDCGKVTPTKNDNFGKDDAEMAAVTDGLTQMIGRDDVKAFSGQSANCSKDPLGFADCCADSGWGIDLHLGSCSDQEKQLGTAKQKGVVVKVGSYCSKKILGQCVQHKEGNCIFPDLLSYDIQDQGRRYQLNRGFGSGESPDCSGLTVQELQQIDFSKINFQNVIEQIKGQANFPTTQSVQEAIQKEIANHVGGH